MGFNKSLKHLALVVFIFSINLSAEDVITYQNPSCDRNSAKEIDINWDKYTGEEKKWGLVLNRLRECYKSASSLKNFEKILSKMSFLDLEKFQYDKLKENSEGPSAGIDAVAMNPDGTLVVTGGFEKDLILWKLSNGELKFEKKIEKVTSSSIHSLAFSPNGKIFVTGSDAGVSKIYSEKGEFQKALLDNSLQNKYKTHSDRITSVAFSPDGKLIATTSMDRSAKIWNVADGSLKQTLTGHGFLVTSASFSPDGKLFATASFDRTIKIYSTGEWKEINVFKESGSIPGHKAGINTIAFSPDGQSLVSGDESGKILLWAREGRILATLKRNSKENAHTAGITSAIFSPDGERIISSGFDKQIHIWEKNGIYLKSLPQSHTSYVTGLAAHRENELLITVSEDASIQLWDIGGKPRVFEDAHKMALTKVTSNTDGKIIVSTDESGTMGVWKLIEETELDLRETKEVLDKKFKLIAKIEDAHTAAITEVFLLKNGQIITLSSDKMIKRWTITNNELKPEILAAPEKDKPSFGFTSGAINSDESMLAVTDASYAIHLIPLGQGKKFTIPAEGEAIYTMSFSHDSKYLIVSSGRKLNIYNEEGKSVSQVTGLKSAVIDINFGEKNKVPYILTADRDLSLRVYTYNEGYLKYKGNISGVGLSYSQVRISLDNTKLLAINGDRETKVYSLKLELPQKANEEWQIKREYLTSLEDKSTPVYAEFFQNSEEIILAGSDKKLKLFKVIDTRKKKLERNEARSHFITLLNLRMKVFKAAADKVKEGDPKGKEHLTNATKDGQKIWELSLNQGILIEDPAFYFTISDAFYELDELQNVEYYLKEGISRLPVYEKKARADLIVNLADLYFEIAEGLKQNDPKRERKLIDATKLYEDASLIIPDNMDPYINAAKCYFSIGRDEKINKKAMNLLFKGLNKSFELGDYERKKKLADMVEDWEKILNLRPDKNTIYTVLYFIHDIGEKVNIQSRTKPTQVFEKKIDPNASKETKDIKDDKTSKLDVEFEEKQEPEKAKEEEIKFKEEFKPEKIIDKTNPKLVGMEVFDGIGNVRKELFEVYNKFRFEKRKDDPDFLYVDLKLESEELKAFKDLPSTKQFDIAYMSFKENSPRETSLSWFLQALNTVLTKNYDIDKKRDILEKTHTAFLLKESELNDRDKKGFQTALWFLEGVLAETIQTELLDDKKNQGQILRADLQKIRENRIREMDQNISIDNILNKFENVSNLLFFLSGDYSAKSENQEKADSFLEKASSELSYLFRALRIEKPLERRSSKKTLQKQEEYIEYKKFKDESKQGLLKRFQEEKSKPKLLIFTGSHNNTVYSVSYSPNGKTFISGSGDTSIKIWNADGNLIKQIENAHNGPVNTINFSPDGKTFISGSNDNSIKIWTADGTLIKQIDNAHNSAIRSVRYSPDGNSFVSGSDDYSIKIWSSDGNLKTFIKDAHTSSINSINYSPSGKLIVSGGGDGNIKIWTQTGLPLRTLANAHSSNIYDVIFSKNEKILASGSQDTIIKTWNVENGTMIKEFRGHSDWIRSITFSKDEKFIYSGSEDRTIRKWNLEEGKQVSQILTTHSSYIQSVSISPDEKTFISGASDSRIQIWNLDGTPIRKIEPIIFNSIYSSASSPDGKLIVSGESNYIKLWKADGTLLKQIPNSAYNRINSIHFAPDGKSFVTGSGDYNIKIWSSEGSLIKQIDNAHGNYLINSIKYSPDGKFIISGANDKSYKIWSSDGTIPTESSFAHHVGAYTGVYHYSTEQKKFILAIEGGCIEIRNLDGSFVKHLEKAHSSNINYLRYAPNGKFVSVDNVKTIQIWDQEGVSTKKIENAHNNDITSLAISPDGSSFATGSYSELKIWDIYGNETYKQERLGSNYYFIRAITFSPDGKKLLIGYDDANIRILELEKKTIVKHIGRDIPILQKSLANDKFIIGIDGGCIEIRNSNGTVISHLEKAHDNNVQFLKFSPDENSFVSVSGNSFKIWALDGKLLKDLSNSHNDRIVSISFSNTGKFVTGSIDKTIKIWSKEGTLLKTVDNAHDSTINSVVTSPDESSIVSGSGDGIIKIWNFDGNLKNQLGNFYLGSTYDYALNLKQYIIATKEQGIEILKSDGTKNQIKNAHSSDISILKYSPDEKSFISISNTGELKIWSKDGKLIKQIEKPHANLITAVTFSPDSKMFFTGSSDNSIKIWNSDGTLIKHLEQAHTAQIPTISISPDGNTFISGSYDKTVKIWSKDGTLIKHIENSYNDWVNSICFTPDGKAFITGSDDRSIKYWTIDGTLIKSIDNAHSAYIRSISLSADGKKLISGSSDGILKIWNEKGEELKKIENAYTGEFPKLNIFNNQIVSLSNNDRILKIRDIEGNPVSKFPNTVSHTQSITNIIFSPDSKTFISSSNDKSIIIWNSNGTPVNQIEKAHNGDNILLSYSPQGNLFISSSTDTHIKIWNTDGSLIKQIDNAHGSWYGADLIQIAQDAKTFISGSNTYNSIKIWNIDGTENKKFESIGHTGGITAISSSVDGKFFITGSSDNSIKLWNEDGSIKTIPNAHTNTINSLSITKSNTTFISSSYDGTIKFWNIDGSEIKKQNPPTHNGSGIIFTMLSSDGANLLSGGWDNTVRIWSSDGESSEYTFENGHKNAITTASFSNDSKTILTGSDDQSFKIWNLNGTLIKPRDKAHNSTISSANYSPSGKSIITTSTDGSLKIWDLDGIPIKQIDNAHKSGISSLSFSPDGKTFATVSYDNTIKLWNEEGMMLRQFEKAHTMGINTVSFTKNDKIISGASDSTIKIWNKSGELLSTTYLLPRDNWITYTPDYYFEASPDAGQFVSVVKSVSTIPIESSFISGPFSHIPNREDLEGWSIKSYGLDQFALLYNRPDILAERLGYNDQDESEFLKKAFRKRIKKAGLPEEDASPDSEQKLPEITFDSNKVKQVSAGTITDPITGDKIKFDCKDKNEYPESGDKANCLVEFSFSLKDEVFKVRSYNIFVNDVAVYPDQGKHLSDDDREKSRKGDGVTFTEYVRLTPGENKIEISCTNERGKESFRERFSANFDPGETSKGNLYYIGIGISNYTYVPKLQFAAKDAKDLETYFKKMEGKSFKEIRTKVLTDEEVTIDSIHRLKSEFLKDATEKDSVVLFISGHGIHDLDEEGTYYYFLKNSYKYNLQSTAIPFDRIEDLLEGLRTRKKLFLIDTCFSGETDEENADHIAKSFSGDEVTPRGLAYERGAVNTARSVKGTSDTEHREASKRFTISNRNRFIFNDLFRRSGAIVFSSSTGNEFSYESSKIQNGYFTHKIKEALQNREWVDKTVDKKKNYVKKQDTAGNEISQESKEGFITIRSLFEYVKDSVKNATDGRQNPTIDKDNLYYREREFRFPVIEMEKE